MTCSNESKPKPRLDRLKQRYFYYGADRTITEGTIEIVIVMSLLGSYCYEANLDWIVGLE